MKDEFSYRVDFGSGYQMTFLTGFTLFWIFLSGWLGLVGVGPWKLLQGVGLLLAVGTALYIRHAKRLRDKYGYVRLDLQQIPYVPGEEAECRLVIPREHPGLELQVQLACFERSTEWSGDSRSEERRRYLYLEGVPTSAVVQAGLTCFPLRFPIPYDHPHGRDSLAWEHKLLGRRGWRPSSSDGVVWQLEVKGPDFAVELEIPVFEVRHSAEIRRPV